MRQIAIGKALLGVFGSTWGGSKGHVEKDLGFQRLSFFYGGFSSLVGFALGFQISSGL